MPCNELYITDNNRIFNLGNENIAEVATYVHLGIKTDSYLSNKIIVEDSCHKLRGTYLSIVNSGISPSCLNPITSKIFYTSIVIPKALYGSELWSDLTRSDINLLDRAHKFCLKNMQSFHPNTSTDFTLLSIGANSIETMIDHKKLQFLGQLCRLPNKYLAKSFFNNRLIFYSNGDKQSRGFLPDIHRILHKYDLVMFLDSYIKDGKFPSKYSWKRILQNHVLSKEKTTTLNRFTEQYPFLSNMFSLNLDSCSVWNVCRSKHNLQPMCKRLMKIVSRRVSRTYITECPSCSCLCENSVLHAICFCPAKVKPREKLWDCLIEKWGYNRFITFSKMSPLEQCDTLLYISTDCTKYSFKNHSIAYKVSLLA